MSKEEKWDVSEEKWDMDISEDMRWGIAVLEPDLGGEIIHLVPSMPAFWGWYNVIMSQGIDQAVEMARFAGAIVKSEIAEQSNGIRVKHALKEDDGAYLRKVLEILKKVGDKEESKDLYALKFSYEILMRQRWTRKQAARFASNMLGYEVSPDTWRKRLDKYIRENDLPKIELPRGNGTTRKT